MAELVVATSAHTKYSGGVVAVRCQDFLGPARGTLTTEIDSRSCTGTAVRDTQKVTTSIQTSIVASHQEADDTLVVDVADIPLTPGIMYGLFISFLIEGDWDVANADTLKFASAHTHNAACMLGFYGTAVFTSDSDFATLNAIPRGRDYYMTANFGGVWIVNPLIGNETLHIRAYSQDGTTIEWLLDQLVFLPLNSAQDWQAVGGSAGDFSEQQPVDGVDGGDANGKYTWQPFPEVEVNNWSGADGGGDWQQKTSYDDAEYMLHTIPGDGYSLDGGKAYAYSLNGIYRRPAEVLVDDDFSRTVNWPAPVQPGGWYTNDITPEGFQAFAGIDNPGGADSYAAVDGSKGILHHGGVIGSAARMRMRYGYFGALDPAFAAGLRISNFTFSGKFRTARFAGSLFSGGEVHLLVERHDAQGAEYYVYFDLTNRTWQLFDGSNNALSSAVNISSWWDPYANPNSSWIGFKLEIKRYLIRVKIWDATSGSEPGSWSFEGFRSVRDQFIWYAYPYTTAPNSYYDVVPGSHEGYWIQVTSGTGALSQWETHWEKIKIEIDPYGAAQDVHAGIEQPNEGIKIGEIAIPKTAWHFVHWGKREWTGEDPFDPGYPYLDFASRLWNPTNAAELQRSECAFWFFRISARKPQIIRYR